MEEQSISIEHIDELFIDRLRSHELPELHDQLKEVIDTTIGKVESVMDVIQFMETHAEDTTSFIDLKQVSESIVSAGTSTDQSMNKEDVSVTVAQIDYLTEKWTAILHITSPLEEDLLQRKDGIISSQDKIERSEEALMRLHEKVQELLIAQEQHDGVHNEYEKRIKDAKDKIEQTTNRLELLAQRIEEMSALEKIQKEVASPVNEMSVHVEAIHNFEYQVTDLQERFSELYNECVLSATEQARTAEQNEKFKIYIDAVNSINQVMSIYRSALDKNEVGKFYYAHRRHVDEQIFQSRIGESRSSLEVYDAMSEVKLSIVKEFSQKFDESYDFLIRQIDHISNLVKSYEETIMEKVQSAKDVKNFRRNFIDMLVLIKWVNVLHSICRWMVIRHPIKFLKYLNNVRKRISVTTSSQQESS